MKFAPLPALVVVTVMQVLLAGCLAFVALKASITHQRAGELYAEQLRRRESSPTGEIVPLSFVRLASKEAASADISFSICTALSLMILVLGGFQLWFATEARKERRQ
jgi:hypothetical protein